MQNREKVTMGYRVARRRAGELLSQNANRLLLWKATLILLLPVGAYFCFGYLFAVLLMPLSEDSVWIPVLLFLWGVTVSLFSMLVMLPLLQGLLQLARRICLEEEVALAELFRSFSGVRIYLRAVGRASLTVLRLLGLALPLLLLELLCFAWFQDAMWVQVLLRSLEGILLLLGLLLWSRRFYMPHLSALPSSLSHSAKRTVSNRASVPAVQMSLRFFLGYAPTLLLGLLTLGILLLADTLPRMLLSYELIAADVCEL